MKKLTLVTIVFFAAMISYTAEAHATEISDYGRQVTEAFLSEFTSLFSFAERNADGTYQTARTPRRELEQPSHLVIDRHRSASSRLQDRAGNPIPYESNPSTRFGLFAMDFFLLDLNNDGIPKIFIFWTHSHGGMEWDAERWTLYLYDGNGGFRDSGELFEASHLDFFHDTNGNVLMRLTSWGRGPRGITYEHVHFDGEHFVATPVRRSSSYSEEIIPIQQLTDVQNEIRKSILAWLYAPYNAPSPLFRETDTGIRVRLDRQFINIPTYEPQPFIFEGRVFAPILIMSEALELTEDAISYLEPYTHNVDGQMVVSVRAAAEIANMDVQWDNVNQVANLTTPRVQLQNGLSSLFEIQLNAVDVEVLHFTRGIYRITITPEHYTIDPSLTPFFFWSSEYGTFSDIIDEGDGLLELIFHAAVGTNNQNVTLILGIEDSIGRFDARLVVLKGNDGYY